MSAYVCVSMCLCVYMCVLSIGLSGGGLSGGRSVYMFAFLSVSLSVVDLSMCLFACLCLSISVCLSLSLCLFAVGQSVGRQSFSVSCRSVTVCTKRAGSGGEDAESESGRLRTQERQIGLMNVGLRTGLRAGIESKKLRAEGAVYKSERLIMRLRTSCGECWGKSR